MPLSVGGLQGTTPAFDLQGHRGAWGLSPQNSLYTVARAMAIGVSTLELDLGVTKDGQVVVNHDRHVAPGLFTDTSALFPGDSQYPYVGRRIADLTLAQLKTLNCEIDLRAGSSKRYAGVLPSPPSPAVVPTLFEVFEMCSSPVAASGGAIPAGVRFNLEAKVHPGHPRDTLAPGPFVDRVAEVIDAYGTAPRTMLSSFDWRVLGVASKAVPELSLAALVNESNFREGRTRGWTAGTDVWRRPFSGDVAAAACSIGATVLCVSWANVTDRLIRSAHRLSMRVIAWTVNKRPTMARLIDQGVDGIITDFPGTLRELMERRGMPVPASVGHRKRRLVTGLLNREAHDGWWGKLTNSGFAGRVRCSVLVHAMERLRSGWSLRLAPCWTRKFPHRF